MTAHNHSQRVEGCYRCDLSRGEMTAVERAAEVLAAHTITWGETWEMDEYSFCRCGADDVAYTHQAEALAAAGLLRDEDAS